MLLAAGISALGLSAPASFAQNAGYVQVALPSSDTGASHGCGLLATGKVNCWGSASRGKLGNGIDISVPSPLPADQARPVEVVGINSATAISVGENHSCALLANGTVKCWGENAAGQLGNGSNTASSLPVTVSGITTATAIAAGSRHTCAIVTPGPAVRCWGKGSAGQLGNNDTADSNVPVNVSLLFPVATLAAGGDADNGVTCITQTNGAARCWGYGGSGAIGNGANGNSLLPALVTGIDGSVASASQISVGKAHVCAVMVMTISGLRCWGEGDFGRLGNNATSGTFNTPQSVIAGANAASVSAGGAHTCARRIDGSVLCFGENSNGQLGNGTTLDQSIPITVQNLSGVVTVSTGSTSSCAVNIDGALFCWGKGSNLGDGAFDTAYTPWLVPGVVAASHVSVGSENTCAVELGGKVKCWGSNAIGQLGTGATGGNSASPVAVNGIATAVEVAVGTSFACARLSSGSVQCWGNGASGQLGHGTSTGSDTPVTVSGISNASSIAAGRNHICALLLNNTVRCWGSNASGQLGNNSTTNSNLPVTVQGITTAQSIGVGDSHSCAVLTGGAVRCWGNNADGQLGNNSTTSSSVPVTVSGNPLVQQISGGSTHTCAVLASGGMICWGNNTSFGMLGNNSTADSLVPVNVSSLTNASAGSLGTNHSCALLATGNVRCWGLEWNIGDGSGQTSFVPVPVFSLSNVAQIDASSTATCARLVSGQVYCWGRNSSGQLGIGNGTFPKLTPVAIGGHCTLDIDGDGSVNATTDGLLLTRALLGMAGSAVTTSATGSNATRTSWADIRSYLAKDCVVRGLAP